MDIKLLEIAIKSLSMEIEQLKKQQASITERLTQMSKLIGQPSAVIPVRSEGIPTDELITLQTARKMLNIGRSSFLKLVQSGIIHPIRINLRTIRYSRLGLLQYMEQRSFLFKPPMALKEI